MLKRVAHLVFSGLLLLTIAPASASASEPSASAAQVMKIDFETGAGPFALSATAGPSTTAFWGVVGLPSRPVNGTKSLWVAGSKYPGPGTNAYGLYPAGTVGNAFLEIPQLTEYYSSMFSYYYLCPSYGAADSLILNYGDLAHRVNRLEEINTTTTPTQWALRRYDLGKAGSSRSQVNLVFRFVDGVEGGGQKLGNGFGPAIDDFIVSGFKYGPVSGSTLATEPGGDVPVATVDYADDYATKATIKLTGRDSGQMKLSWQSPATSAYDPTPDSRDMSYRVWRKPKGAAAYSELTSNGSRLSSAAITDAPMPGTYTYTVQAWDPNGGADHGLVGTPRDVVVTAAPAGGTIVAGEYSLDDAAPVAWSGDSTSVAIPYNASKIQHTVRFRVQDNDTNWSEYRTAVFNVKLPSAVSYVSPSTATSSSNYGSAKISGYLKSGSTALTNRSVTIQHSADGKTWSDLKTVPTSSVAAAFSYTAAPTSKRYYRVVFKGDSSHLSATSSPRVIYPRVAFSAKPKLNYSTLRYGSTYSIWGYFKPKHALGSTEIKIQAFRRTSTGKYLSTPTRTYTAKVVSYNSATWSKYLYSMKLPYKGTWRIRAYHPLDSKNAATYSSTLYGYTYVTVK